MVWVNNRLTFYELYSALRNMETFHNIHVPSQNTVFVKINGVLTASQLFFQSEIEVTEVDLANALRVRLHSHQSINMFKRYI